MPLAEALQVLLRLAARLRRAAEGGRQRRPVSAEPRRPGKTYQLMRVRMDPAHPVGARDQRPPSDGLGPADAGRCRRPSASEPRGRGLRTRACAPEAESRPWQDPSRVQCPTCGRPTRVLARAIRGARSAASAAGAWTWAPGPASASAWPVRRIPASLTTRPPPAAQPCRPHARGLNPAQLVPIIRAASTPQGRVLTTPGSNPS